MLAGDAARVESYGIPDDALLGVGLMCGGAIDVLVRAVHPGTLAAADLATLATATTPAVFVLQVRGGEISAGAVGTHSASGISPDALALRGHDAAGLLAYDADGCLTESESEARTRLLVVPFGVRPGS